VGWPPDRPDDLGGWHLALQLGQREQAGGGRVPGPNHQHPPPGEAVVVGPEDVGQPAGDPVADGTLAKGRQPGGAQGVGLVPGARGVDHCPCLDLGLLAVGCLHAHHQRLRFPPWGVDLVHAAAGDRRHPLPEAKVGSQRRQHGKGVQVAVEQLLAGGELLGRRPGPARGLQHARRGGVQVVAPG
jgi:hypothetical protein